MRPDAFLSVLDSWLAVGAVVYLVFKAAGKIARRM